MTLTDFTKFAAVIITLFLGGVFVLVGRNSGDTVLAGWGHDFLVFILGVVFGTSAGLAAILLKIRKVNK